MIFREMREDDLDAAAALEAANFSRPWSRKDFAAAHLDERYLYYVAEAGAGLIGLAGLIMSPPEADISNVSVSAAARRQHVASGLLKELIRAGRGRGIDTYFLEVRASNAAAIGLYEGLGFVRDGIRRNFYEAPREDAVLYSLRGMV